MSPLTRRCSRRGPTCATDARSAFAARDAVINCPEVAGRGRGKRNRRGPPQLNARSVSPTIGTGIAGSARGVHPAMNRWRAEGPLILALALGAAWVLHTGFHLLWFNLDHDGATRWMEALGIVTFTHCFGESGWSSHLPEVSGSAIPVGTVLNAVALPFAAVALVRARGISRVAFVASVFAVHLGFIGSIVLFLRDMDSRAERHVAEVNDYLRQARARAN